MIFIVISSPGWMTVQETWKNHSGCSTRSIRRAYVMWSWHHISGTICLSRIWTLWQDSSCSYVEQPWILVMKAWDFIWAVNSIPVWIWWNALRRDGGLPLQVPDMCLWNSATEMRKIILKNGSEVFWWMVLSRSSLMWNVIRLPGTILDFWQSWRIWEHISRSTQIPSAVRTDSGQKPLHGKSWSMGFWILSVLTDIVRRSVSRRSANVSPKWKKQWGANM